MLSARASSDTALTRCGPGASSTMRYVPAAVRPTIWLSMATLGFEAPPKAPPARYTWIRAIPGEGLNVTATACNSGGAVGTDTHAVATRIVTTSTAPRRMLASFLRESRSHLGWIDDDRSPIGSERPFRQCASNNHAAARQAADVTPRGFCPAHLDSVLTLKGVGVGTVLIVGDRANRGIEDQEVRNLGTIAASDTLVVGWTREGTPNQAPRERDRSGPIMVAGIGEARSGDGVRTDYDEHDKRRKRHALVGPIDPLRPGLQQHLVSGTVAQPNHNVDRDPRPPLRTVARDNLDKRRVCAARPLLADSGGPNKVAVDDPGRVGLQGGGDGC